MDIQKIKIEEIIKHWLSKDYDLAEKTLDTLKPALHQHLEKHLYCILESTVLIPTDDAKAWFWFIHSQLLNPVAQSINGKMIVDVKTQANEPSTNYRKSTDGFQFHTDGVYKLDTPPQYIVLACIEQADVGGDSFVIDGQRILAELKTNSISFDILSNFEFCFKTQWNDNGLEYLRRKIIELNTDGTFGRISFYRAEIEAGHAIAEIPLTDNQIAALNLLEMLFFKHVNDTRFRLQNGDFLIVNNHKMIHGRMPFKEQTQKRHLLRMWADELN